MKRTTARLDALSKKLLDYGTATMTSEELVEMLLLYTLPTGDTETEPLARRICAAPKLARKSLDGDTESLFKLCEEILGISREGTPSFLGSICRDREDYARLFVDAYRFIDKEATLLLLFDNRMRTLSMEYVSDGGIDSARFHGDAVIKKALLRHASAAVIGVNRKRGIAVPTAGELHALRYLRASMKSVSIPLLSGVIVSGERYAFAELEEDKSIKPLSATELAACIAAGEEEPPLVRSEKRRRAQDILLRLLSYAGHDGAEALLYGLLRRGIGLSEALIADGSDLLASEGMTKRAAVLLLTVGELLRRHALPKEARGMPLDERSAATLVRELYDVGRVENVFLLLLDGERRLIAMEKLESGVANAAAVLPRRLLELALFYGASGAYLIHTHPGGVSTPSAEDISVTRALHRSFSDAGCPLLEHIVVADRGFTPILSYMEENGIE